MKLSMSLLTALAALAFSASPAHAQSVAKAGGQCDPQAEESTPELECLNPDPGDDVRLYVMEFQSCDARGNIKAADFDRSVGALVSNPRADGGSNIDYVQDDGVQLSLSKVRTRIDSIPGANVTMVLPTSATVKDAGVTYKIKVTTQTEPDYDGALDDESHFKGSFVKLNSGGKQIGSGRLECSVAM